MEVVIWIIIILIAVFLIWILRKWIKRIIFIVILLWLAFFIYWLFSPSGASRLWYNVRTFPQRVISWISSTKDFIDYDSYKLDISSVWAKDDEDLNNEVNSVDDVQDVKENKDSNNTIKSFSWTEPTKVPSTNTVSNKSKTDNIDTWYSKNDLLWIISRYVENNLDDDTDILVTIEYEDDKADPDRIILQTQPKVSNLYYISMPRLSVKDVVDWLQHSRTQTVMVVSWDDNLDDSWLNGKSVVGGNAKTNVVNTNATISNWLTQKDVREAEEIFSNLF